MRCRCPANPAVDFAGVAKIFQVASSFEIIWALVGSIFCMEASQADVWQRGEEIALASAGETGAGANDMSSVRSFLSYIERATFTNLSPPSGAPVRITVG